MFTKEHHTESLEYYANSVLNTIGVYEEPENEDTVNQPMLFPVCSPVFGEEEESAQKCVFEL